MIDAEVQAPQHGESLRPAKPRTKLARREPGTMRLQAVREAGHIVDFTWEYANPAAARLIDCNADDLCGKRLAEVIEGPLCHPALIDRYRRVIEHGNAQSFAQVHRVAGRQDVVVHRVVRVGDGVLVTLTNLSANRRAQALRLGLPPPAGFDQ